MRYATPSVTGSRSSRSSTWTTACRGGFWVDEAIQVAQWLEADGSLDALELTMGSSLLNPMYLFKGDAPVREFADAMPQPQARRAVVGKPFFQAYPYGPAVHARAGPADPGCGEDAAGAAGRRHRQAGMDTAMAEGFEFVAMARALLREPDLINRIEADSAHPVAVHPLQQVHADDLHPHACVFALDSGT